ncbi:MAG TPA: ABC transporter permease, partial [Acidimicrobiales bacterium]
MWRTTISSLRAHKRRLLGTCLAVVLGVAFLSGTLVLGDSTRAGFKDLFTEANEGTDAYVRSATNIDVDDLANVGLLDEELVDAIAALDGVAVAEPVIEGSGQIIGRDGDPIGGNGPPTIAGNWISDPDVNPYSIVEGEAPSGPGEVVIDKATAEQGDLEVGDTTTIRTPAPVEVTITGVARFGSSDGMAGVTYAAFTLDEAQQLLMPEPDRVTAIRVAAADGTSQEALADRIAQLLPDDAEVLTGAALTQEQQDDIEGDFLGAMENFLLLFAGIALVVAGFSIYNTFSIVVAQRSRESALLRALGASRRQVLVSTLAESLVVGVVASMLGLLAGVGLAAGLTGLMDAMGFPLPGDSMPLRSDTVIVGMALGVIVTVAASVGPAIKAARVLPLAALRDVAIDRSDTSRARLVAGAAVTAAGVGLTVFGATSAGSLSLTGLGSLALLVGLVMLGPVVARPAGAVLGAPLARFRGISGQLARGNAMRNPKRTAGTASALMVGVAVVAMFTVIAASLKAYIDETVDAAFAGDLVMVSDNFSTVGMSPE